MNAVVMTVIENPGNMSDLDCLILLGFLLIVGCSCYILAFLRLIFYCVWYVTATVLKYVCVGLLVAVAVFAGGVALKLLSRLDNNLFSGKIMRIVDVIRK